VETTKPAPDLIKVAVDKVEGARAVAIGDTTWDAVAAGNLEVPAIAVRTGGFSAEELREAGAGWVYESLDALRKDLDATPLRRPD
jgi:phosphoglycolate phosphatase-like HAD superfamily hydrolase